jgi:DNA mismatch repair protein MutS
LARKLCLNTERAVKLLKIKVYRSPFMPYTASTPTDPHQANIRNADHRLLEFTKLTPMMQRYVEVKEQYPHALFIISSRRIFLSAFSKMQSPFRGN